MGIVMDSVYIYIIIMGMMRICLENLPGYNIGIGLSRTE